MKCAVFLLVVLAAMVNADEEWEAISKLVFNRIRSRSKRDEWAGLNEKPVKDTTKGSLTQKDRAEFIMAHNLARSIVNPTATNMPFMRWNDTLESYAQRWARKCNFNHGQVDKGIKLQGQNLWVGSAGYKAGGSVYQWDIEKEGYNFSNRACSIPACGHYTQVVWHKSVEVGCGIQFCETMIDFKPPNSYIVVCNYLKAGNYKGKWPYENGTSCDECPEDYPTCENKLCRQDPLCGDLKCKNGGTMNTTTCLCDCGEDPDNKKGPWCGDHPAPIPGSDPGSGCSRICLVLSPRGLFLLTAILALFQYSC